MSHELDGWQASVKTLKRLSHIHICIYHFIGMQDIRSFELLHPLALFALPCLISPSSYRPFVPLSRGIFTFLAVFFPFNLCILYLGQSWRRGVTNWGFDPHSRLKNIYINLYFQFFALVPRQSAALNSATQPAVPLEFGGKCRTECVNIRFPLPTLLWDTVWNWF